MHPYRENRNYILLHATSSGLANKGYVLALFLAYITLSMGSLYK